MSELFSKDYYENGKQKHISLYENYRWMPERSLKEAHYTIKYLNINSKDTIIDYGCAKGFLVKALRILNCNAYGYDTSKYAINNCDRDIKKYVSNNLIHQNYTKGTCKDVLEHCNSDNIDKTIRMLKNITNNWLIIVPLAKNNKYIIKEYEQDITHNLRFTKTEWINLFTDNGFLIKKTSYNLLGLKDNWNINKGNLFIFTK